MDINALLNDKAIKPIAKRNEIVAVLQQRLISISDIHALTGLNGRLTVIILEAMEEATRIDPELADLDWLRFAEGYILAPSNSLKREASRVVGNIAHLFPDDLETVVPKLIENTGAEGTVVRWGSAYTLGRIVVTARYADSRLFEQVAGLAEAEQENGVKSQYLNGLKKAAKIRNGTYVEK